MEDNLIFKTDLFNLTSRRLGRKNIKKIIDIEFDKFIHKISIDTITLNNLKEMLVTFFSTKQNMIVHNEVKKLHLIQSLENYENYNLDQLKMDNFMDNIKQSLKDFDRVKAILNNINHYCGISRRMLYSDLKPFLDSLRICIFNFNDIEKFYKDLGASIDDLNETIACIEDQILYLVRIRKCILYWL